MEYRREIDGLRALAVLPVILFHAGFQFFSGGFIGVDIFFVISGYLITSIILSDLEVGKFSILNFYERRARRILPVLFFVLFACLPFAWLWLYPQDMKSFAQSLVAVSIFASNILFWTTSGYFDAATELKPLLHTWSLAVEEQYYVLFPIFLVLTWRLDKRRILIILGAVFVLSLIAAQWGSTAKPSAAFYLLPTRAWELLIGAFVAFYFSYPNNPRPAKAVSELASSAGLLLIIYSIFAFNKHTPFPSLYTLVPTVGAALIIIFADQTTLIGRILGNKIFVGLGLISYSAYLWHQPLFAFTRHLTTGEPSKLILGALVIATFVLASLSWKFVETPFRNKQKFSRKHIFILSILGSTVFIAIGVLGNYTNGFKSRFDIALLPKPWSEIKCHGKAVVSQFEDPLAACLGVDKNGKAGDIFLIGDSHAAQLTFPLKSLAESRAKNFHFINTENLEDFPYSFWISDVVSDDRLLRHLAKVSDAGDIFVVAFHRGYLNEIRDEHIPMHAQTSLNEKTTKFIQNMERHIPHLVGAGLRIYFVKDTPLLPTNTSLEKCAYLKNQSNTSPCTVSFDQDQQTRSRQSLAFDRFALSYPNKVTVLDPLPVLYQGQKFFNPIYANGTYKMFDQHHLTEAASLQLLPYFQVAIP